jgi:pimeloyl-ACP methyl ester carboxylesterase
MGALRAALYESDLIPQIPRAIHRARQHKEDEVWRKGVGLQAVIRRHLVDGAANFVFACHDIIPFTDTERLRQEDRRLAFLRHSSSDFSHSEACKLWGVPPGPSVEHERVRSAIPTLLLSGEHDPATPPSSARSVARGLSRGYLFEFPGLGHWVTVNTVTDCPKQMTLAFLDDPTRAPSGECITQMRMQWATE